MSRVLVFFVLFFVAISISAAGENTSRTKNVQTALRARWPGTPILLEAGCILFFLNFYLFNWMDQEEKNCFIMIVEWMFYTKLMNALLFFLQGVAI